MAWDHNITTADNDGGRKTKDILQLIKWVMTHWAQLPALLHPHVMLSNISTLNWTKRQEHSGSMLDYFALSLLMNIFWKNSIKIFVTHFLGFWVEKWNLYKSWRSWVCNYVDVLCLYACNVVLFVARDACMQLKLNVPESWK